MSDIEILRQMIKETAMVPLSDNHGRTAVTLTEPHCAGSSVSIVGLPDDAIVIRADAFASPDSVFTTSNGACKRADFVIVAELGKKRVIVYIEMKDKKGSEKEIVQQLTGARCFVAYCREVGRRFWHKQEFLDSHLHRFVSIGHISIGKRRTRIDRQPGVHDSPERMLKIDWPYRVEFSHLAGVNG